MAGGEVPASLPLSRRLPHLQRGASLSVEDIHYRGLEMKTLEEALVESEYEKSQLRDSLELLSARLAEAHAHVTELTSSQARLTLQLTGIEEYMSK